MYWLVYRYIHDICTLNALNYLHDFNQTLIKANIFLSITMNFMFNNG